MKKPSVTTSLIAFVLFICPISIFASVAPPSNDVCSSPTPVTPGTTCISAAGTTIGATFTAISGNCGGSRPDVWFSFTARSTNPTITVSGLTNAQFQVYTAASCGGSVTSKGCVSAASGTVTGLTIGSVYLIRVYQTTGSTASAFTICLTDPVPSNDDCSTPTSITPVTSCGATNNQRVSLATETGSPTSLCGAHTYDVWYKFTVPAGISTFKIVISSVGGSLNSSNAFIEAFSATACSGLVPDSSLGCSDIVTGLTLTSLTPNQTYYFRVFTTIDPSVGPTANWMFSVCVLNQPPSNDDCANATFLKNDTTNLGGTVWNATASSGIPVGCATGTPDDDVWYKFVARNTSASVTLLSAASGLVNSGPMIQVFSGTCGSLSSVACGNMIAYASGLTVADTYYVRVYSFGTGALSSAANSAFSIMVGQTSQPAGRMNEVFKETIISKPNALNTPWEVTYGPDGYLWVTENKGYKAYHIDPATGNKTIILDISQGASGYLTAGEHTTFNVQFTSSQSPWPQGGFTGLALHPKFLDPSNLYNFVYISYVRKYDSASATTNGGYFFKNSIVRFNYNTSTQKLESPVMICDTLPGSSDHNSQRMIIIPVGDTSFLFYGAGDMGAGQLSSAMRLNHAQDLSYYQGKILRFNLEPDGDAGAYDQWIPNGNPYNNGIAQQSAIWALGVRNNQGFAYDTTNKILYGSSHGPYSDDEINIIERKRNYGHPYVIGFAADGNYNNSNAGAPNVTSSLSVITDEVAAAAAIPNYKDPLFSGYPQAQSVIHGIWTTSGGGDNRYWPSEAWSGIDFYSNTLIPGWKNSLLIAGLKWGRVLRLKLGSGDTTVVQTNGADTVVYFGGVNRYRDIAFAPGGRDIYASMEGATAVGPNVTNPMVPACTNCIVKFSFEGYRDVNGKSSIPAAIDVTAGRGIADQVDSATTITIDDDNNNLWVPITGNDGNILAEINAHGNNLGVVRSAFYKNSAAIRARSGIKYLDRNMTITPEHQPSSDVSIRLYFSKTEFDVLDADPTSGVSAVTDLKILKNSDACGSAIASSTLLINPSVAELHGTDGYVLQGDITSFSSFYFASSNILLPLNLLSFKGSLQGSVTLLQWETTNEVNTSEFIIERSVDGHTFQQIGTEDAKGSTKKNQYDFTDNDVTKQSSLIVYYRLKMIDRNGGFTYSQVVSIILPSVTSSVAIFPNPAVEQISVNITTPTDGKIHWKLTDNAGRIVMRSSSDVKKGSNSISVNIKSLSTGFYFLSVSGAGIDQKVKLEKL